ncbi:hypothetical protein NX059_001459 [Plenodomus lindquistii]|nr:hypothetical protein NX059_001459 [Plenodomus lindquistii]
MDSLFLYFTVLILRSLITDKHTPSFRIRIFSDIRNVVYLLQLLGCVFDSSLMPILCSGRPPSIQQIKSMTGIRQDDPFWRGKWGVYIVVLEKPGCRPKLYVGSSVDSQAGLFGRVAVYFTLYSPKLPKYVYLATQKDWEVTYVAVPFYFTKPTTAMLLGFAQTLVLSVKHTLTFRLWTMVGRWKNCTSLALWKREDQEYDGANNHSCMREGHSMEEATPEEIEQDLRERKERNYAQHRIYKANNKEKVRAVQKVWDEEHAEERKIKKRKWNDENADHVREYGRELAKRNKEEERFVCEGCEKPFANKTELERHRNSEVACKPKRDAARTARLTCGGCGEVFAQMANLERHHATGTCRTVEQNTCPTCGRVIKSISNMRRHQATHK